MYAPFSEKEMNNIGNSASSLAGHIHYYYFFLYLSFLLPPYPFFIRSIHGVHSQIINPLRTSSYFSLHLYSTWPNKNAWSWLWQLALPYTQVRQPHRHRTGFFLTFQVFSIHNFRKSFRFCSCTLQFFTSSQWPTHGGLLKIWPFSSMKNQFSIFLDLTVKPGGVSSKQLSQGS